MIENDEELDKLEKELREKQLAAMSATVGYVERVEQSQVEQSAFSKKMDDVKQQVLVVAAEQDEKFAEVVVENVKDAAVKYTQVEQRKAELERQKVQYESEKLDTQQLANVNQQLEDKWINRQKRREYHYNGVKPIMLFVGITEPMNLIFLYFFATVLIIPFFIAKLFRGTIGALLCGAEDTNRSKAAKGFIWTIIAIVVVIIIMCLIHLYLKWQCIDVLAKFKKS